MIYTFTDYLPLITQAQKIPVSEVQNMLLNRVPSSAMRPPYRREKFLEKTGFARL